MAISNKYKEFFHNCFVHWIDKEFLTFECFLFLVHSCWAVATATSIRGRTTPDTLVCPRSMLMFPRRRITTTRPVGGWTTIPTFRRHAYLLLWNVSLWVYLSPPMGFCWILPFYPGKICRICDNSRFLLKKFLSVHGIGEQYHMPFLQRVGGTVKGHTTVDAICGQCWNTARSFRPSKGHVVVTVFHLQHTP